MNPPLPEKSDLPRELLERDQWIIWRDEAKGDKITKVPHAPWRYGGNYKYPASVTDPENWVGFDSALEYAEKGDDFGVGYCFSPDDDIVGMDLDDCIDEDGNVEEWASETITKANSYTELSPSNKGVHIILRGKLPSVIKHKEEGVEVYDRDRFFTLTGRTLKGQRVLRKNQVLLDELWERYGEKTLDFDHETVESPLSFPITKLFETGHLDRSKFRKVGSEYRGSHPIHGSTTGTNFSINPEKNNWICWRHDCGGGSLELLAVLEGIIECGSWGRGETPLKGGKWSKALDKAKEHRLITEKDIKQWKEPKEIKISDLQAELINHPVRVQGQIVAEKSGKAIPRVVRASCSKCGASLSVELSLEKGAKLLEIYLFKKEKRIKAYLKSMFANEKKACSSGDGRHEIQVKFIDYADYAILFVRDLMKNIRGDRRAYEPKRVHLVGDRPPNSKKVEIKGRVVQEPESKAIIIIADHIRPLKTELESFTITSEDREAFTKYFSGEEEIYREVAPHVVGEARELAKKWYTLTLFSPPEIPNIHGRLIRGYLLTAFFGDTSAGKSETAKDLTDDGDFPYPLGSREIVETGGRTGLLYTIDTDRRALIWGSMVLHDLGFLVLDGLSNLTSEELAEFREVLRTGRVSVRRTVSGDAWARPRIVACFNPDSPMDEQLFACLGITDTEAFSRTPEITRWDVFIPFNLDDVPPETIAGEDPGERPIPPDVFYRHVLWAWTRKWNDIEYTSKAKEEIKSRASELMEKYASKSLPIVSNESFNTICRISVAKASTCHSTDSEHEKIIVEKKHVEDAIEDYVEVLEKLELASYKLDEEERITVSEDEFGEINIELEELDYKILSLIGRKPRSSSELARKLDCSTKTVKKHYARLKNHDLIETKRGVGAKLTSRGIKFLRLFREFGGLETKLSQEELVGKIREVWKSVGGGTTERERFVDVLQTKFEEEPRNRLEEVVKKLEECPENPLHFKPGIERLEEWG